MSAYALLKWCPLLMLIAIILLVLLLTIEFVRRATYFVEHEVRHRPARAWVLAAIVFWTLISAVSVYCVWKYGRPSQGFHWLSSAGMIFSLCVGLFTLLGLAVTIGKLRDSLLIQRFVTLREAIKEIKGLIEAADSSDHPVRIVCYTPAVGNLTHPGTYAQLSQVISGVRRKANIQLVCLDADELRRFYDAYEKIYEKDYGKQETRGNTTKSLAKWANDEAEQLILGLDASCVKRKGLDTLPAFHLFVTNKKGVIYFPLDDYPFFFDLRNAQRTDYPRLTVSQEEGVEILGFVTTEKLLLDRFEECFNFCKDKLK